MHDRHHLAKIILLRTSPRFHSAYEGVQMLSPFLGDMPAISPPTLPGLEKETYIVGEENGWPEHLCHSNSPPLLFSTSSIMSLFQFSEEEDDQKQ